jgi:hypothetical protein
LPVAATASGPTHDELVAALTRAALDGERDVARALASELERRRQEAQPSNVVRLDPFRRGP